MTWATDQTRAYRTSQVRRGWRRRVRQCALDYASVTVAIAHERNTRTREWLRVVIRQDAVARGAWYATVREAWRIEHEQLRRPYALGWCGRNRSMSGARQGLPW